MIEHAFPSENSSSVSPGMTLRDYFAAAALQGLLVARNEVAKCDYYAKTAYALADAMLKVKDAGRL